jgi:hypothetical protein
VRAGLASSVVGTVVGIQPRGSKDLVRHLFLKEGLKPDRDASHSHSNG